MYNISDEKMKELMDIPNKILPHDANAQAKTFPIRSIKEGIRKGLDPYVIGDMVYEEMSQIPLGRYEGTFMIDIRNYAKYIQADVQKLLLSCIEEVEETVPVKNITLNVSTATLDLEDNKIIILSEVIEPDNATDKSITWKSSNTDVATVDAGVVTAVGAGEADITVTTSNNLSATCKITVSEPKEPEIEEEVTD